MAGRRPSELRTPSLPTLITAVAVFVALGGPAAVASGAGGAARMLTGAKVKNGSVETRDFSRAARLTLGRARGPAGPTGLAGGLGGAGARGAFGAAGADGAAGAPGTHGIDGSDGIDGAPGAPGSDGEAFSWRGAWSCDGSYEPNDVVSREGSSFVATAPTGGCAQPPSGPWELMADRGVQGTQGTSGVFNGRHQSPNGLFFVEVTDAGVKLGGPSGSVQLDGAVSLGGTGLLSVQGSVVRLNGSCQPVARQGELTNSVLGWTLVPLPNAPPQLVTHPHTHAIVPSGATTNTVFGC